MTIHATDPFATPDDARSPLRRLRARMPATVTLWTAYGRDGRPAGLTVSSTVVAEGDPGLVLGLLDDESDLYAALLASGRFVAMVLRAGDDQLADRFAGLLPAPGGLFGDLASRTSSHSGELASRTSSHSGELASRTSEQGGDGGWEPTEFGPVRAGVHPWVGCTLSSSARVGYGIMVQATVDRLELGDGDLAPLVRYRGRYLRGLG